MSCPYLERGAIARCRATGNLGMRIAGIGSCFSIFLPIGGNGPGNGGEREAS